MSEWADCIIDMIGLPESGQFFHASSYMDTGSRCTGRQVSLRFRDCD
jgi:hypothetical protein